MALTVLNNWGVHRTGLWRDCLQPHSHQTHEKSESDRREDFDDVYEFATAFEPVLNYPATKIRKATA